MADDDARKVDAEGRILIQAHIRKLVGLMPGQFFRVVGVDVEQDRITIERVESDDV